MQYGKRYYGTSDQCRTEPSGYIRWDECARDCQKNSHCNYWSYDIETDTCVICDEVEEQLDDSTFMSGAKDCIDECPCPCFA